MTPEGLVKGDVHKLLHRLGCIRAGTVEKNWPPSPRGWYYMPVKGVAMGVNGIPDFVGHIEGRFFSIETKAPGKRNDTSPNQDRRILEIETSGGLVVVVDDVKQLENVLT